MLANQAFDKSSNQWFFHAIEALTGKGVQQQLPRSSLLDSARAQIEQSILIDLADRRAMGALHVIGMDLQLRLGVNSRVIGEQQIAVRLFGVGLLRVLMDNDAPVEYSMRLRIQNSVVELAAFAVRAGMLDEHVIVEVLMPAPDKKSIDQALRAVARKHRMHVVAH